MSPESLSNTENHPGGSIGADDDLGVLAGEGAAADDDVTGAGVAAVSGRELELCDSDFTGVWLTVLDWREYPPSSE